MKKRLKQTAALMMVCGLMGPISASAQTRDLVNDNPYYRSAEEHTAKGGGNFGHESNYFKEGSAYFPGKSRYFKNKSPYVKNNAPGVFERFVSSVKSLLS